MKAPVGRQVGIYMDTARHIEPGDVIQTQTRRSYLVDTVRVQQRGVHVGRQHLRCTVIAEADVPADAVIHPIFWYSR